MKTIHEIKTTLDTCTKLVAEFHDTFQIQRFADPFAADLDTRQLRARLHAEEFAEWVAAGSPIDTLDAICDLAYVHAGTLDQLNIPADFMLVYSMQHSVPRGVAMLRRQSFCAHSGARTLAEAAGAVVNYGLSVLRPGLFEKAFAEVHRSNMAKLWTQEEIKDLKNEILERVVSGRVVKDLGGKILKPPSWTPPNLAQFI